MKTGRKLLVAAIGMALAERFLNAHWLNPAFLIPLVELICFSRGIRLYSVRLKSLSAAGGERNFSSNVFPRREQSVKEQL